MVGGLALAGVASAAVFTPTTTGYIYDSTAAAASEMNATDATTLQIAEGGVGHMLLVPYFSAQNGNMSVFHVVNTDTESGKVIKVRFRSAANSDDILDFQVFLSPGDVWTASVAANADTGVAELKTYDTTCTRPAITPGTPVPFVTTRLDSSRLTPAEVNNQTREGYVEVFTMADIPGPVAAPKGAGLGVQTPLFKAIKHVNGVAPCSVNAEANATNTAAAALVDTVSVTNWTSEAQAATQGLDTPSTGLAGDWYIINVPQTTTFSGAATSIVALNGTNPGRGNFVHFPQDEGAVPASVAEVLSADPLFRLQNVADHTGTTRTATTPALEAANYDFPDMSTPYVTAAADNLSPLAQAATLTAALAVQSVSNQYANDTSITAKTDWVFSMPTRRYSVAANYANTGAPTEAGYRLFSNLIEGGATTFNWFRPAPAGAFVGTANTSIRAGTGLICVNATSDRFWDREETTPGASTSKPVFSPSRPGVTPLPQFCGETSVLAIGDTGSSVLAASVARESITSPGAGAAPYKNGWYWMSTANSDGTTNAGLPILGSSFIKLSNPDTGAGVSGTYGITWPHRFTK